MILKETIMANFDDIEALVIKAVQLLADDFELDTLKEVDSETPLFGGSGALDSMALVNLIADLEDVVMDELGHSITLADEKAMSAKRSPFADVKTLTQAILERLPE